MKIRTIIVEDEPLACERLRDLLEADGGIELVAECSSGGDAVAQIRQHQPDLVFLDIQLPELDGFGVLAALSPDRLPAIIFVTAYDRFALRAFEVHALDYLLKPFDRARFGAALKRVKVLLSRPAAEPADPGLRNLLAELRPEPKPLQRIAVKSTGRAVLIKVDEIDWIDAADNYVNLHLGGTAHLHRETMSSLEARLPAERFVRISRSCMVNAERVREVQPSISGGSVVILEDGTELTGSRTYRDRVKRLLGEAGE